MKNPLHSFVAGKQADTLTLYCYDVIGADLFGDGITAQTVAAKLDAAGNFSRIQMRINSPGGDPFEAIAISNLLKSKAVAIDVHIDGLAASAASVLAMAGDTISIADNGMVMIHNAMSMSFGDASDMRKMADTLDKVSGTLVDTYAARTKLSADEIKSMMNAETWMNAQEAVAKNFADKIEQAGPHARAVAASFDLSTFKHTPAALKAEAAKYTREELMRLRLQIA